MLRAILDCARVASVSAMVRSQVSDARVAQMLDHFSQYVGSAPDQSPAVLCGIAHIQTNEGVWYPRGGTGAVPRALEASHEARCRAPVRPRCAAHPLAIQRAGAGTGIPTAERKSRSRRWWQIPTACELTAI